VVHVFWFFFWLVVLAVFLFWAARRTRGRGIKDSPGGAADHPTGKYI
jgi:hypothetical protein